MHLGKVIYKRERFEIIDCSSCGFIHLNPIPREDELKKFYEMQYYQEKRDKIGVPEKIIREKPWYEKVVWKDMLDAFNAKIKGLQGHPKSLLDIGCGNGYFLKYMQENGWEVIGIEPSLTACEYARSLNVKVYNMTIEEFKTEFKKQRFFDAINLSYVLEHSSNPKEVLEICRDILKNNGVMCVAVPNDFNSLQLQVNKLVSKPSWWIAIPDHINYFNFKTLERLLNSVGFEILLRTTSFPMELFLLMGDDYVENDEVGSMCHQKRMNFELALPKNIRRKLYQKLASLGLGRECIVYAKPASNNCFPKKLL